MLELPDHFSSPSQKKRKKKSWAGDARLPSNSEDAYESARELSPELLPSEELESKVLSPELWSPRLPSVAIIYSMWPNESLRLRHR